MKTYEYEGFDKATKKTSNGTVQAETGEEAILYLLQSGIYPTGLVELSNGQARSNNHLNNLKKFRERLLAPPNFPNPTVGPRIQHKPKFKVDWESLIFFAYAIGFAIMIFFMIKQAVSI